MTPLVFSSAVQKQIRELCQLAAEKPVNIVQLVENLKIPAVKSAHMEQMTRQSIHIPIAFTVTYSMEVGHPCGLCRHMSMSVQREGRSPNPIALWMIAEKFGFWGGLNKCAVWEEDLQGHGHAINILQPTDTTVDLNERASNN